MTQSIVDESASPELLRPELFREAYREPKAMARARLRRSGPMTLLDTSALVWGRPGSSL